jgi:hypothetical protein
MGGNCPIVRKRLKKRLKGNKLDLTIASFRYRIKDDYFPP